MGYNILNTGIDPNAGEWKHEILWRISFGLIASLLREGLQNLSPSPAFGSWERYWKITIPLLFLFATSEGILRRSWKIAILLGISMLGGRIFLDFVIQVNPDEMQNSWASLALVGGFWGFMAGWGTRNLLATWLGLIVGSIGGFAIARWWNVFYELAIIMKGDQRKWMYCSFCVYDFANIALLAGAIGLAVWVGVKFSKPRN